MRRDQVLIARRNIQAPEPTIGNTQKSQLFLILCAFLIFAAMNNAAVETEIEKSTRPPSGPRIDGWRTGTGGPFNSSNPASRGRSRETPSPRKPIFPRRVHRHVTKLFNARLTKPLVPTMRSLHTDADTIAVFDGEALALDGWRSLWRDRSSTKRWVHARVCGSYRT